MTKTLILFMAMWLLSSCGRPASTIPGTGGSSPAASSAFSCSKNDIMSGIGNSCTCFSPHLNMTYGCFSD